jgi:hypothetical protein
MARVDHLTGGIYRISTYVPESRIGFNQFLIDDDEPALIHTGTFPEPLSVPTPPRPSMAGQRRSSLQK